MTILEKGTSKNDAYVVKCIHCGSRIAFDFDELIYADAEFGEKIGYRCPVCLSTVLTRDFKRVPL